MTIAIIVLSITIAALLVILYFERKRCYNLGYGCAQKLANDNLEIFNLKFWRYDAGKDLFCTSGNAPSLSWKSLDDFVSMFSPEDQQRFFNKIDNLKKGKEAITKFSAKLNENVSPSRCYAYISMSVEKHFNTNPIISGTFCQTPENIPEFFKGIPTFASFKTLFEEIPVGVILCTSDGYVENVNQQVLTIFKIENKNLFLSKNYNINTDRFYKGPTAEVLKHTGRFVMIDEYNFDQNPNCKRTGKATILYTAKVVTDLKGIEHIFITVNDISSNILFDDRFHSMYINGKTLLKMSPVGVTIFDYEGGRIYVNNEFAASVGCKDVTQMIRKRHKLWDSPILDAHLREQMRQCNSVSDVVTIDFSNPEVKEYFGSELNEVKHFKVDYRRITNSVTDCSTYIITCLDVTAIENERRKCHILEQQRNTLVELGDFVPWLYNPQTHEQSYLCERQFPELPEIERLSEHLYLNDLTLLNRRMVQVMKHNLPSSRLVVNYRTNNTQNEPYEVIVKDIEGDNSVLCVAKSISNVVIQSPKNRHDDLEIIHEYGNNSGTLSQIIDNLSYLFFIKDVKDDFRYVAANKKFCESLDLQTTEVIGKNEYEFLGITPDTKRYRNYDLRAIKVGSYDYDGLSFVNGMGKTWRVHKDYVKTDNDGEYIVSTAIDITQLTNAKRSYEKALQEVENVRQSGIAFLTRVSHEIRTPLHAIVGFAQLLIDTDDSGKKRHFARIITEQSDILVNLISDILDMSKREAAMTKESSDN